MVEMLLTSANASIFLMYSKIQNKKIDVDEKTKERGHVQHQDNKMVLTCTVSNIQKMLIESGTQVSLDKVSDISRRNLGRALVGSRKLHSFSNSKHFPYFKFNHIYDAHNPISTMKLSKSKTN